MASKPETTFLRSVHKKIPNVHAEKMANPWRSGTADVWYSGTAGDLWIEYKYIPRIPRSAKIIPDLTPQQARWCNARFNEGRNVAVVLGTPTGGVIYRNQEWMRPMNYAAFIERVETRAAIAQWIFSQVGPKYVDSQYGADDK